MTYRQPAPAETPRKARRPCAQISTTTVTSIFGVPAMALAGVCIAVGVWPDSGWFLGLAAMAISVLWGYVGWGHSTVALIDEEDHALVIERWHWSTLREVKRIGLAELASVTVETDTHQIDHDRGMPETRTVPWISVNGRAGAVTAIRFSSESQRESARLFAEAVTAGVKRAAKKVR